MSRLREFVAGQRFGRLTVLATSRAQMINFVCDCGTQVSKRKSDVNAGRVKSCGCLRAESCRRLGQNQTHGLTKSPTYKSWCSMLSRCTNPNATAYDRYGGAGIGVCEAWHSFESFLEDMGPRPEGTSLDRINSAEGYSKGNCRWATRKTQNRNTRANVFLTALGKTQTVSEWAEQLGMKYITLYRRVYHSGWSHHDAVTTPVKP